MPAITPLRASLVVLSGGQDSFTCLGVALRESVSVMCVSFDYGQRHVVELRAAEDICRQRGLPWILIDLKPILKNMTSSALISEGELGKAHPLLKHLPASFVPARNALFLTAAYGLAMENGCDTIYAGMCQTDYSGYPDCRDIFIKSLNATLDVGYESLIEIKTPLMWLTKAQTFELAFQVNILEEVVNMSITCYEGETEIKHAWGMGCGVCPACVLRKKGWEEFQSFVPTID